MGVRAEGWIIETSTCLKISIMTIVNKMTHSNTQIISAYKLIAKKQ